MRYAPVADADYDDARRLDANEAGQLAAEPAALPDEHLVLEQYHGPDRLFHGAEADRFAYLRSFYRELQPGPEVRRAVEAWARDHLGAPFVVGVNVRTGNGHYFGKGALHADRVDIGVFEPKERFLRVLRRACAARVRTLPKPLRADPLIFVATDSAPMADLLKQLGRTVTRRHVFPPPGSGDTYEYREDEYSDRQGVVDTLADMLLLARCDALVYNTSVFNQYARVLTGCFGGNFVHFETLFLRKRLELQGRRAARLARRARRTR